MTTTYLHIKNMCCDRCIGVVQSMLKKLGYSTVSVAVGEVVVAGTLSQNDIQKIKDKLIINGFDIAESSDEKIAVKIHAAVCRYINEEAYRDNGKKKLSAFLAEIMNRTYFSLSRIFSSVTGLTIEKYYVRLKMEKAKEMLVHDEYGLSDIAWQLGYGSQQTFNTQFKKETGKTPGEYKLHPVPARIHWDELLPQNFKQNRLLKRTIT